MKPFVLITLVALVSAGCAHLQTPRAQVHFVADSTEGLGTAPGTGGAGARFSEVDEAIDWIKNHKTEVALGTVIVIAGVAFVLSTGGAGALVLVPLAL